MNNASILAKSSESHHRTDCAYLKISRFLCIFEDGRHQQVIISGNGLESEFYLPAESHLLNSPHSYIPAIIITNKLGGGAEFQHPHTIICTCMCSIIIISLAVQWISAC